MKIFSAFWLAALTVALLPGCKFADALIGPRLPPSESKQRKLAEAQAVAAAAEAPPAPTWTQTPLDVPGDAPAAAGPATAPVVKTLAPATAAPEAPAEIQPAPLENPYTNNQFYNPEIPKTLSISLASQDDEQGPKDAINGRLRQMEDIVKQGLAGKGYTIVAPGAGGAQEAKLVIDYDSTPAHAAGDKGWDHEVKLSIANDGHDLGSVSCRWSNLNSATIDTVLRPLTVRAVSKVPAPSAP